MAQLPAEIHEFKRIIVDRSRQLNRLNEIWPSTSIQVSREAQNIRGKVESLAIWFYLTTKGYRGTQKYRIR